MIDHTDPKRLGSMGSGSGHHLRRYCCKTFQYGSTGDMYSEAQVSCFGAATKKELSVLKIELVKDLRVLHNT